jgi:hypothetical protein
MKEYAFKMFHEENFRKHQLFDANVKITLMELFILISERLKIIEIMFT